MKGIVTRTVLVALVVGLLLSRFAVAGERSKVVPAPVTDEITNSSDSEVAVVAGGCFWGVQGLFQHVNGVTSAVSGYAGGATKLANYEAVSLGITGHAESVRVTFDPRIISYGRLLQIFFSVAHDPTELNRQGPDIGRQYRSALFPMSDEQARVAKAYIAQLNRGGIFKHPVVTTVESGATFSVAERYHPDFLFNNPTYAYIAINDLPKLDDLKHLFPDVYRPTPVLVLSGKKGTD